MTYFPTDRRSLLKGGATLLAAAATMSAEDLLGYAKAWAQTSPWKPEPGAKVNMMRWKRFVEAEDVAFMKIVDAFQKANNVTINISNESYDDVQPKASVAANTGQGLDMVWGLYTLPFLFSNKCVDMTDVADYLGKKCGGWTDSGKAYGMLDGKWIGIPVAATGGLINYRISAAEKAGFKQFPKDLAGMAEFFKAMNKNGTPGGMALGHASGDANGWVHWALWAHGGNLIDKDNKVVINSPETAKALEAEAREAILKTADEAIFARRNFAVERERAIRESELDTEIAVEQKKRAIRETQMDAEASVAAKTNELREAGMVADIGLEARRKDFVALNAANTRTLADAEAYRVGALMKIFEGVDTRVIQALAATGMQPGQLIAQAFSGLAEKAEKIGQLNVSPELLNSLMQKPAEAARVRQ